MALISRAFTRKYASRGTGADIAALNPQPLPPQDSGVNTELIASLPSSFLDTVALNPQPLQPEEAGLNAELIASLPSSLIDTVPTELQRHDPKQDIVRPADQIGVGSMAREENSLKNVIDDDVAHGAERWWRERVMPWSPSDYIGGVGSYPIQGDRMRAPLFVQGAGDADEASINDIKQQHLGDCYFLAALAAVARHDPQRIKDMVEDHGDGTYTVTFKQLDPYSDPPTFSDRPITVSGDFPGGLTGDGHAAGADVTKQVTVEIWPLVFEKAFGVYRNEVNPYGQLALASTPKLALEAITGHPVKIDGQWDISEMGISNPIYLGPPAKSFDELLSDFQAGKAIAVFSGKLPSSLISRHFYAVDNVYQDAEGRQWVQLYNPWGDTHPGPMLFEQLQNLQMYTA